MSVNGKNNGQPVSSIHGGRRPGMAETFAGKHLLVTGVTGFLGKVWLAMLLDFLPEVGRVTVVIRGKKGEDAEARFARIYERSPVFRPLRQKLGQELRTLVADKVRVLDARLVEPLCGLDLQSARELMKDIDAVVHFAGLTDFEPDPQQAIDANVHGGWHAADLAALSPARRYVHVSTTYVAGKRSAEIPERLEVGVAPNGTSFDPRAELEALEAELRSLDTKGKRVDAAQARAEALGWPNIYTYTKGLSEQLIATRDDVITTTFRPAIVECARSYPFEGWNEGINTSGPLVWLLSTSFRRFPGRPSNIFDVVPVDTVARTMMLVVGEALRDEAEEIYQCASGHRNPLTMGRAVELCALSLRKLLRDKGTDWEKHVLSRLEAYCHDPSKTEVFGYRRVRQAAKATRNFLRDFKLERKLSPDLYERVDGERLQEELRSFSMKCRTTDRKLGQVDDMLRQYKPFIYDYSYVFHTDNLTNATARLSDEERELWGFDVDEICWRHYWSKVQIPGLDKWSLPLLRGEKVPEDEPLPPPSEINEDGVRLKTGEVACVDVESDIRATA